MLRVLLIALLMVPGLLADRVPVVVELFTSEGCSSCPPADRVLAELEKQPLFGVEIIVLGQHVDYWDRLGWRDPYSSEQLTARQGEYARAFRQANIYTPQMVVQGQTEFIGSEMTRAKMEIERLSRLPRANVMVGVTPAGTLRIAVDQLPAAPKGEVFEVYIAITESGLSSDVASGENAGRRLLHSGVVRSMIPTAHIESGKQRAYTAEARINLQPSWKRENCRVVVFVQERGNRRIVGAGSAKL